jgi:hypothetical protein
MTRDCNAASGHCGYLPQRQAGSAPHGGHVAPSVAASRPLDALGCARGRGTRRSSPRTSSQDGTAPGSEQAHGRDDGRRAFSAAEQAPPHFLPAAGVRNELKKTWLGWQSFPMRISMSPSPSTSPTPTGRVSSLPMPTAGPVLNLLVPSFQ